MVMLTVGVKQSISKFVKMVAFLLDKKFFNFLVTMRYHKHAKELSCLLIIKFAYPFGKEHCTHKLDVIA